MVVAACNPTCDINFQGKHAGESFAFHFHQHWVRLVWPVTKMFIWNTLILSIGYVVFAVMDSAGNPSGRIALMILTAFFLLSHFELLSRFYRYFLYVTVVTDRKIHRIKKSLLTVDDHQSIDLWMLQDIFKCQHGILQNALGYGSLILEAQETVLRLHFTPRITERAEKLLGLREQGRIQMTRGASAMIYGRGSMAVPQYEEQVTVGIGV